MNNSIITLEGVVKRFGNNEVVKNLNLEVGEGEFLTLLGPSGCGKTTTLRMIAGFEEASEGIIKVEGERVEDKEPFQRNVNTVFQNYALFPHMTVFNNIAYGLTIKKVPKAEINERVTEMLKMVQMEPYAKRKPDELSGGQKQRVAIARALVNRPKVLLLDEPLGALDLKLRKQMQIELKRLQKKLGITFIYVTHDQEEALTMSDRIAVMHDGILEQLDSPTEIYEHPKTRFVAGFIGESNIFDGKVIAKDGDVLTVETAEGNLQVVGSDFAVGEEMHVSIRPEYLEVSASPVSGFTLEGKIKDFIYQGSVVKTAVDLKGGMEVKYSRFEQDQTVSEGAAVYVCWKPEKAVAIKKFGQGAV
ncbi:ABC transporter ATP-binding protein [Anaerotignum sp.]|nr:ABC transporter ATP-binding protein [Anaerotignum sp.]MBP3306295.1 ABC transporter ATP-binding protein [Anaerotignum sp.]